MKLLELIKSVKDHKLSKEQLEGYHEQMSHLFAEMQLEMADLEKAEAIFLNSKGEDESVASVKIRFKATQEGQRLIMLKRYALATKEMIASLKSRIYTLIY